MSIPKEPRQLMINIMYLVLSALLALNVSAEIFNAFKVVNKGLISSNKALDTANDAMPGIISERAKKKGEYKIYADRAPIARQYSKELSDYIDGIVDHMIDESGDQSGEHDEGDYVYVKEMRELQGKKDKDITTRYLVNPGRDGEKGQVGAEVKDMILQYKDKFLTLIDSADQASFASEILLDIDDETWRKSDKPTWEAFNFNHMPLGATLPIFNKFKNDAKATEAAVLNYLMGKVGGEDIVLDRFTVVSAPKKSYVIKGEPFETEVFLSASASAASNTGVAISVNGSNLKVDENGVAKWSGGTGSVGVKNYNATATVTNPVTGEVQTYKNTFSYEVGERSCNVAAEKMNVFYIGVDNPVSVTAAGISTNDLNVSASGAGITMTKSGNGKYIAKVASQGTATITVSGGGLAPTKFDFRAKRIPNPRATLSNKDSGAMNNGEFKAQGGVIPVLDNFDFEARCNIAGFTLVRVARRQDPEQQINRGGVFSADSKRLVAQAKPGDTYYFENIRAKCPGDKVTRKINDLIFRIK